MKKAALLLVSSLVAAGLAAPALADDGYGGSMAASEKGMMSMEKKESGMMMGSHKMTGTVENIDHAKGMLTLKAGGGIPDMRLHFPPPSIKDLKNGDTITVELGFTK